MIWYGMIEREIDRWHTWIMIKLRSACRWYHGRQENLSCLIRLVRELNAGYFVRLVICVRLKQMRKGDTVQSMSCVLLCHASVVAAGMAAGMIVSGSVFTLSVSASSGVDSLIEMRGGGGILSFSTSSSEEVEIVLVLRMLPAVLAVFLLLPLGAGSRFGVARL